MKADARVNMDLMSATDDTSHFDRSWLNPDASENMDAMQVMADTSQFTIDVCSPPEQSPNDDLTHSSTAVWSACLDSGLNAAVVRVRK